MSFLSESMPVSDFPLPFKRRPSNFYKLIDTGEYGPLTLNLLHYTDIRSVYLLTYIRNEGLFNVIKKHFLYRVLSIDDFESLLSIGDNTDSRVQYTDDFMLYLIEKNGSFVFKYERELRYPMVKELCVDSYSGTPGELVLKKLGEIVDKVLGRDGVVCEEVTLKTLEIFCYKGFEKCVRCLVEKDVFFRKCVARKYCLSLRIAVYKGRVNVMKYLLDLDSINLSSNTYRGYYNNNIGDPLSGFVLDVAVKYNGSKEVGKMMCEIILNHPKLNTGNEYNFIWCVIMIMTMKKDHLLDLFLDFLQKTYSKRRTDVFDNLLSLMRAKNLTKVYEKKVNQYIT